MVSCSSGTRPDLGSAVTIRGGREGMVAGWKQHEAEVPQQKPNQSYGVCLFGFHVLGLVHLLLVLQPGSGEISEQYSSE